MGLVRQVTRVEPSRLRASARSSPRDSGNSRSLPLGFETTGGLGGARPHPGRRCATIRTSTSGNGFPRPRTRALRYRPSCRNRVAFGFECAAFDSVDVCSLQTSAARKYPALPRPSPYTGSSASRRKPYPAKRVSESSDRVRLNRLGAVKRRTPRTQIESFEILVSDLSHAKFIGEIRRRTDRAAMAMNRPEPSFRPAQEMRVAT